MPIVAATLEARVGADTKQAEANLRSVAAQFDRTSASAKASASGFNALDAAAQKAGGGFKATAGQILGFGGAIGIATAGTQMLLGGIGNLARGAVGLAGGLLQAQASMEQTQVAFKQLLGSGDAAAAMMEQLRDLAAATPFEFPELAKNARLLLAFGDSAKEVVPHLTAIGDAVSALGGGSAEIDRVTRAIGQMESKGRILAEEMNQLSEIGINGFAILAQETGKSEAELRKLGETGQLAADTYIPLLYQGLQKVFGGGMAAQAQTFNGLWSQLKDNIRQAALEVSKPIFERVKDELKDLVEYTKTADFDKKVDEWTVKAEAFADSVVANAPAIKDALVTIAEGVASLTGGLLKLKQGWDDLPGPVQKAIGLAVDMLDTTDLLLGGIDALSKSEPITPKQLADMHGYDAALRAAYAASLEAASGLSVTTIAAKENMVATMELSEATATAASLEARLATEMASGKEASLEQHDANMTLADSIMELYRQQELIARSEYEDALGRQAEAVAQQGRDAQMAADALLEYSYAQSAAAFATDKAAEANAAYNTALDTLSGAMDVYATQAGQFQRDASAMEKAYDILIEKQKNNIELTDDQVFFLENYETAHQRAIGGIEDANIAEGEAALAKQLLITRQEELNAAIARGEQDLQPYLDRVGEAQDAVNGFAPDSPMKQSMDAITNAVSGDGGLIAAINLLIDALNDVDGKDVTADVEVDVERSFFDQLQTDLSIFGGSSYTATATTTVVTEYQSVGAAPPDYQSGAGPSARQAEGMSGRRISDITGGIAAAREAAVSAREYTDLIDEIVGYMAEAAERMGDGMEAAEQYAGLADAAVQAILSGAELLRDLNDAPLAYTEQAAESIAAIKFALEHAVQSLSDSAALMSVEAIEHAETYAAAAEQVANALLAGTELLAALATETVTYGAAQERAIADLKFALEKAVISLADAAALMDLDGLDAAERLADAAGAIFGALSDTLDFLRDITEASQTATISSRELAARVAVLVDNARLIADEFAAAAVGWKEEVNPSVSALSDAISDSSGGLADTLDVLAAITGDTETAHMGQRELAARANQLADDARIIAEQFASAAAEWQGGDVSEFADAVQSGADAILAITETYAAIADASDVSKQQMELFYDNFIDVLHLLSQLAAAAAPYEAVAAQFAQTAANIAAGMAAAAAAIASAAASGAAALEDAADAAQAVDMTVGNPALAALGNLSPNEGNGGINNLLGNTGGPHAKNADPDRSKPSNDAVQQQADNVSDAVKQYAMDILQGEKSTQEFIDTVKLGGIPVIEDAEAALKSMASELADNLGTALLNGSDLADDYARQLEQVQDILEELEKQAGDTASELQKVSGFGPGQFNTYGDFTRAMDDLQKSYSLRDTDPQAYADLHGGTLLSSGLIGHPAPDDRDIVFEMNGREWGRLTGQELMRGKSMRRKLSPC